MAARAGETLEESFRGLVRAHVHQHPLCGTALSAENVHFVASKLLLLQSTKGKAAWPGADPLRLAAALFVLFCDEGLNSSSTHILGVGTSEIYEHVEKLVRTHKITADNFREAVLLADMEGSATELVHTREVAVLWDGDKSGKSDPSGLDAPHKRGVDDAFAAWLRPKASSLNLALCLLMIALWIAILTNDKTQQVLFTSASLVAACGAFLVWCVNGGGRGNGVPVPTVFPQMAKSLPSTPIIGSCAAPPGAPHSHSSVPPLFVC